jgi:uncharacterized protein YbjQ (UPF0145 family)
MATTTEGEWRADPTGRHQYRWWDGERLTDQVADGHDVALDPIDRIMISTMNDIPGYRITKVLGECFGLTVRSRGAFSQTGEQLKSAFGGELKGMTQNLQWSRQEVIGRMCEEARRLGGNAVLAMRFDTSAMNDMWTEICAYGTAVVIETDV